MRTLASIAKAANDAFSNRRDASVLHGMESNADGCTAATRLSRSIGIADQAGRSVLADIEIKAHYHRAPLQTTALRLDGVVVATAYSFERRLLGMKLRIHEGVILLSTAWEAHLMPWLCHRLQDFAVFDLATFRVVGFGPAQSVPAQFTIRNRVMTAIMRARDTQEVMVLDENFDAFLGYPDHRTQRDISGVLRQAADHDAGFRFTSGAASNDSPWRNMVEGKIPFRRSSGRIASIEGFLAAQSHPYQASLTHRDGHLLSLAGGFLDGNLALVAYQLTHRAERDTNPAPMLRSLLMRQLISQGARYLAFVGDCAGPLRNYCAPVPAADLLMVRNTRAAHLKQQAYLLAQPGSPAAQLSRELAQTLEMRILG